MEKAEVILGEILDQYPIKEKKKYKNKVGSILHDLHSLLKVIEKPHNIKAYNQFIYMLRREFFYRTDNCVMPDKIKSFLRNIITTKIKNSMRYFYRKDN